MGTLPMSKTAFTLFGIGVVGADNPVLDPLHSGGIAGFDRDGLPAFPAQIVFERDQVGAQLICRGGVDEHQDFAARVDDRGKKIGKSITVGGDGAGFALYRVFVGDIARQAQVEIAIQQSALGVDNIDPGITRLAFDAAAKDNIGGPGWPR